VLVATSTLAWGVNTPAHLVVIKGTEYYDAPSKRYVDFPITDVLQVRGCCKARARAGCSDPFAVVFSLARQLK
jgi:replicative superfamily II helicase